VVTFSWPYLVTSRTPCIGLFDVFYCWTFCSSCAMGKKNLSPTLVPAFQRLHLHTSILTVWFQLLFFWIPITSVLDKK
jgi:hypothetical protein